MSAHSKLKMSLIVVFSKIFDYDTREPKEILEPYGKALTLKMIAVMNSILQKKIIEIQRQIIYWFGTEGKMGEIIISKIFHGYREEIGGGARLILINHYTNLKMNILAISLPEVKHNMEVNFDESHLDFFIAYIKMNEIFADRQDSIGKTVPAEYSGILRATWLSTASLISSYDFSYFSLEQAIYQLIKVKHCTDFLCSYNNNLFQLYLASKKITSFQDYATKIFPLLMLCNGDAITINGKDKVSQDFLELYNHQNDIEENKENIEEFDFLPIRNKPLYLVSENEYVIINRAMIFNKVYNSIYWDCKSIVKSNPALGISENRFRADYTTHFSEGYLVYKLMKRAYENKSVLNFSGAEMKKKMKSSEPDYYVRNGNKVFLVEVKDSFISGVTKQSFNINSIQEEIKKKYYSTEGPEKAIMQLITRIKLSLTKKFIFDQNYKPQSLRLYPILIVYDINLTVPGIESLMIEWFKIERDKLINELKEFGIIGFQIKDLVILHIDGLIGLTEYIRAGKVKLEILINNHLYRRKLLLKIDKKTSFNELKSSVLDSYLSFNQYVMDFIRSIPSKERLMSTEFRNLGDD